MKKLSIGLIGLLSVYLLIAPAFADPLSDALATYRSGNFSTAKAMLTPLAEAGDASAQDTLYHLYWYGKGTPTDFEKGLKWARDSAALGNADAEHGIAMAYSFG